MEERERERETPNDPLKIEKMGGRGSYIVYRVIYSIVLDNMYLYSIDMSV